MAQFEIAHLREQGQDMIIIPLDDSYGYKSNVAQNRILNELQMYARAAGLAGTVVTVWDTGNGRMGFLAPSQWQPFFSSMSLYDVAANLNKTLICGETVNHSPE